MGMTPEKFIRKFQEEHHLTRLLIAHALIHDIAFIMEAYHKAESIKIYESILKDCDLYASDQYRIMSRIDDLNKLKK